MNVKRISPATAIASAALFFSLGGAGMAADHYLIMSTNQIKPSVLRQFHGRTGPQGPAGQPGQAGATGATRPAGAAAAGVPPTPTLGVVIRDSQAISLPAARSGVVRAPCPAGHVALSGGYLTAYPNNTVSPINIISSESGAHWVIVANGDGQTGDLIIAQVVCGAL